MKIRLISSYKPKLIFQKKVYDCQIGLNGVVGNIKKKKEIIYSERNMETKKNLFEKRRDF